MMSIEELENRVQAIEEVKVDHHRLNALLLFRKKWVELLLLETNILAN